MAVNYKELVVAELNDLPASQLPEVLSFIQFIKSQSKDRQSSSTTELVLVTVPAAQIEPLNGILDLSGNALEDSENLYA